VGVHGLLDGLEAQERLGEDLFGRIAAQDLVNVANLDLAGGSGLGCAAVFDVAAQGLGGAHVLAVHEDLVAQPDREQGLAVLGKVRWGGTLDEGVIVAEFGGTRKDGRLHQLEVLLILPGGAAGHLVDPFADVLFSQAAKAGEGGKN